MPVGVRHPGWMWIDGSAVLSVAHGGVLQVFLRRPDPDHPPTNQLIARRLDLEGHALSEVVIPLAGGQAAEPRVVPGPRGLADPRPPRARRRRRRADQAGAGAQPVRAAGKKAQSARSCTPRSRYLSGVGSAPARRRGGRSAWAAPCALVALALVACGPAERAPAPPSDEPPGRVGTQLSDREPRRRWAGPGGWPSWWCPGSTSTASTPARDRASATPRARSSATTVARRSIPRSPVSTTRSPTSSAGSGRSPARSSTTTSLRRPGAARRGSCSRSLRSRRGRPLRARGHAVARRGRRDDRAGRRSRGRGPDPPGAAPRDPGRPRAGLHAHHVRDAGERLRLRASRRSRSSTSTSSRSRCSGSTPRRARTDCADSSADTSTSTPRSSACWTWSWIPAPSPSCARCSRASPICSRARANPRRCARISAGFRFEAVPVEIVDDGSPPP